MEKIPERLRVTGGDIPGTVGYVVKNYLKSRWDNISPDTRMIYIRSSDRIIASFGMEPASALKPQDILDADYSNGIKSQVMNLASASVNWARKVGHLSASAVWSRCGVPNTGEWEAWTREDVERAKASPPFGVMRDVVLLAAYTGMRKGDILSMDFTSFYSRDGVPHLAYTQSKTGTFIDMPLATTVRNLQIVQDALSGKVPLRGKVTKYSFYRVYQRYCKMIGVKKPFHGLRKHCATILAEAGCSMPEIMSITGHESTTTAMKYIRSANKKTLAVNAMARIDTL